MGDTETHLYTGRGVGAEVGVWKGDHAKILLAATLPKRLYLVDPWEKNDDNSNRSATVETTQSELDLVCGDVRRAFIEAENVTIIRRRSTDAAASFTTSVFDWVYIDARHDAQSVCDDLRAWSRVVKADGVLAGHDFNHPAVYSAVVTYCGKNRCDWLSRSFDSWAISNAKPRAASKNL